MSDLRQRFEAWITSPPFEKSIERYPDDETRFSWPGNYCDINVELAWQASQMQANQAQAEIDRLAGNNEYFAARSIEQAKLIAVLEHELRAPFGAGDVRRLQEWLGVTGSVMTDESWDKLDDKTRRLYVSELVAIAAE
jgi:hypothetical protein